MAKHLSAEQLAHWDEGTLAPEELRAADEHLATCDACHEALRAAGRPADAGALASALFPPETGEPFHLSAEEVAAFVEGAADATDQQIALSHLESCFACGMAIKELRAFRALMSTQPARDHAPAPGHGAWAWRGGRRPAFARLFLAPALGIAAAALLLGWFSTREAKQVADLRRANRSLVASNEALRRQAEQARGALASHAPPASGVPVAGPPSPTPAPRPSPRKSAPAPPPLATLRTPPVLTELIGRPNTLVGEAGDGVPFALLAPVGTTVMSDRPSLRWRPLPDASGYRVTIINDTDPADTQESELLTGTEWTVPRALRRGSVYSWEVVALREGEEVQSPQPPAPDAKFKVLELSQVGVVLQARRKGEAYRLELGRRDAEVGLLDEAEAEFQAVLEANPGSAPARRFLEQVRRLRRPPTGR